MKYLNKIIFINSANIPYAEIAVDGNVHFTGTQGVGKSTLLRALLFFYNADKQRLGIQQGQKSFDEFYFKLSNSYILYEVVLDHSTYTVLVSRYQGRASWRFIDSPYKRDWLIDDGNQVLSDWTRVRERLDKSVTFSARIDSGSMFKDIIYGNSHDHKYSRYAMVQSPNYDSIPRSIQNVFLNTKLDADFVKNTIIQSMADEDLPIDLQSYRRLIANFEQEYDEIDCWFRKSRNGNYPVRQLALKIAEQGRTIVALEQQMMDVWHMLNYAVADSQRQIPLLEKELEDIKARIEKEKGLAKDLFGEYEKEKAGTNQELGAQKDKLKEISTKRKYYESIDIKEMLLLADRESSLKKDLSSKETLLNDLLKTNESIEEKYKIAIEKLENGLNQYEIAQKEIFFQKQDALQKERKRLDEERTKNRNLITENYRNWARESDERLQMLLEEQHTAESVLKELHSWHPKTKEIQQVEDQLRQLDLEEKEIKVQQQIVKNEIAHLTTEYELKESELKQASQKEQERLADLQNDYCVQISIIDELLSHFEGSLYQWLSKNMDGWENTIGKVVDEKRILYAQGLEPKLKNASDSFFGITLNLDNIDSVHRTPDEYRAEKEKIDNQLRQVKRQLSQLPESLDEEVSKLSKKYGSQLNPLRQEETKLNVKERQIPMKRQTLQNQKHNLEMDEQEMIEKEKEVRQRVFNDALLKVKAEKDERENQRAKNQKDLKDLDSGFNKSIKNLEDNLSAFKKTQEDELTVRKEEFKKQREQLNRQQHAELEGRGVDMKLLDTCRHDISELRNQLSQIDADRNLVVQYRNDVRERFDKEPEVRLCVKNLEQKLKEMQQRYEVKNIRIQKIIQEQEERHRQTKSNLVHRQEGLSQYQQVVDGEHLVPDTLLSDNTVIKTTLDCQGLLSQLRGSVNQKRDSFDSLRETVTNFNRNFKPQNAFHFNTLPVSDKDYMQISVDLQEFMDNNKIEEFRRRTSEHYKDILGRISTEVNGLLKRRTDVDGIILDINRDFVEKNFAGVIKSIELRANESSDRLMQLLVSIQKYADDNAYSIGELNLFSGEDRDEVNRRVVDYLKSLARQLQNEQNRSKVSLEDAFRLQFRVKENDNDTNWVERINNVGSDGTDILVKAMVNIMLINVFKKKAAKKSGDFIVHCMMDEIGRLHPNNIKGILQFANSRNIYLINSSPTSFNAYDYKYTYILSKNGVKTKVEKLMKRL